MRLASLGLNPAIPNECWLIPRKGIAEPQYGYGGLRKLVLRSAEVIDCFSREVCANDLFEAPESLIVLPLHRIKPFVPRGRVVGYYNVLQKHNGNWLTLMMSVAEVEAHRDRYAQKDREGKYGPSWSQARPDKEGLTNFDKMGLKTVLRMNCNPRDVTLEAEVWAALQSDILPQRPPALTHAQHAALPQGGTGVSIDLQTGEVCEPVVVVNREHTKTVAEHINDLYGGPTSHPGSAEVARRTPIGQQIDALLRQFGDSAAEADRYWLDAASVYPDLTPGALSILHGQLVERLAVTTQARDAIQIALPADEALTEDDATLSLWEQEARQEER
jgi:hypothetical protein